MSIKTLITSYAGSNLQANRQFADWLQTQTPELLQHETASSFSGILQTLNHIWAAEETWCTRIFGNTDGVMRYGLQELDAPEVFEGIVSRSAKLAEMVSQLPAETFEQPLSVKTPWFEGNLTIAEYLLHVFNHGTYHRGQIVTMAHQLGLTQMPSTDFLFFCIQTTPQH
ncbi:Uncharacterized damage-inducible protein DinB (forms a four-helix bundle) [Flexibacter flexilis DSM 6793]|uniref:Uncharacterized damage-inducible protein DinB (Forms a four-helix bundle) n=1 Tax=Flexibacter flexilis DSM 6793 TaxID=927664 RepID=A0A1I1DR74_9BACT|nr:DinB family protein [Flexibacter flexilis]SFB77401.1 Uncharacterized damage-inducible protein DinB (forms a four-helix bundle) [Flexibacter flexilis DSM 6793]